MTDADVTPGRHTSLPSRETPRRRRGLAKLSWTTGDQIVASVTNAALAFLVARQVTASEFGAFSFAFIAFIYAVGIGRGLVSEPLMVRFSGASRAEQKRAMADSAGSALVVGAGMGVVCLSAGLLVGGLTGELLVALAILLPGLLLQDHWRLAFFTAGRPRSAFVIDMAWGVPQLLGVIALTQTGRGGPVAFFVLWGLTGALAAALGAVQAGVVPRLRGAVPWLRNHRDLGLRFSWGFIINQGAFNSAFVIVGAVAGAAAVGAMRGAEVLMGPIRILVQSLWSFGLPVLATKVSQGTRIKNLAVVAGAGGGAVALAWAALVLMLPTSVGEALLGDTWTGAREVVGVYGLLWVVIGVASGAVMGLKAYARAREHLRIILVQAPLAVILGGAGAAWNGALGAATGLLIAQAAGLVVGWGLFLRVCRQTEPDATHAPRP